MRHSRGSAYSTVLFDLDGTLSESAPGILGSLQRAFAEVGVAWVDEATARSLLGPPFSHSLPPLVGEDNVDAVVAAYRRHYVEEGALLQTRRYDGIGELVATLFDLRIQLAVATSKPEPHAIRIVGHLGLADYFATICGDTVDGQRDSKAQVIGEVLRRLGDPAPESVLMVGDRSHDVLGAAAHGVHCAGALWGYGTRAELEIAGALRLCAEPGEVLELVRASATEQAG
ncbi:MAG: HAD hydrolase-like protein [Jatrophihabitantaceae bacterium]